MSEGYSSTQMNENINSIVAFNTYQQYSWINNSLFYPLVPRYYYDYYNRFVRQWFYWYDGFNPNFHSQESGMFSSRIAYTLCNKLAGLINGGTLMFDAKKTLSNKKIEDMNALQYVEHWAELVNLTNKINTTIEYSLAGGDSIIKVNSDGEHLYPTVLRKDNYLVDTDFTGKVTGFTGVIYTYTKMRKQTDNSTSKEDYYYLLEEREYDDEGNPKYRVYVKVGYGNLTTNKSIDFESVQEVKWDSLSKDVRKAIKNNYPDINLGEWYDLPLKTLGVYLFKASDGVSFLPQLPFGESILSNQIANMQLYDYLKSLTATEMYISRGRVLLPEGMDNPNEKGALNQYSGLDSMLYKKVRYLKAEDQKPIPVQFELRAEDIIKLERLILRDIAMGLSVSERTIANFLTDGSERATAREISVDDSTATFVENKRSLYKKPLNDMLCDTLYFYNFNEDIINVRFSRVGLNNMNDVVQQTVTLKQNYLIDRKTALDRIYVDMNDEQINTMLENINKEMQEEKSLKEPKQKGTSDEDYEEENNNDINHTEKVE